MKERNEPIECDRARYSFDHFAFGQCWIFDQLVADEVGQQELVGARASEKVVEVVFGGKDVLHNADEAPFLFDFFCFDFDFEFSQQTDAKG